MNLQPVSADADQLARHRVRACIQVLAHGLIAPAHRGKSHHCLAVVSSSARYRAVLLAGQLPRVQPEQLMYLPAARGKSIHM